jgi:hypothetical protein
MADISFEKQLDFLINRFYVNFSVSPTEDASVNIYNISKLGFPIPETYRQYKGETLPKAIHEAYLMEFQAISDLK